MLLRREAVRALAGVKRRLLHPVPDCLGGRLELARQLLRRSPFANQLDEPLPELRRRWLFGIVDAPTMGCPRNRVNSSASHLGGDGEAREEPSEGKGGWTATASVDCGSGRPAHGTPREALPQCAATVPPRTSRGTASYCMARPARGQSTLSCVAYSSRARWR